MAKFVKGDVVVVPFPFSDLSQVKRRPALVVTALDRDDLILCQITSQRGLDKDALRIAAYDFEQGGLKKLSYVKPNRLFTTDQQIILYKAGHLKPHKMLEVIKKIVEIFER